MRVLKDGSLLGFVVCLAIALGAGVWAVHNGIHWFNMLFRLPEIITLNSAATALFGVSQVFFVFVYASWQLVKTPRDLTEQEQDVLTRILKVSLVMMFALPIVSYWSARIYLPGKGYKICDLHPYHRAATQDAIYVLDTENCPYGYSE